MTRITFLALLTLFSFLPACSSAPLSPTSTQSPPPTAVSNPPAPTITLDPDKNAPGRFFSSIMKADYRIYVGLPESYGSDPTRRYPVVFLLDGDWYFDGSHDRIRTGGVQGILAVLSRQESMPEAILVSIGYFGQNQRYRDLLSEYWRFYGFLTTELIPVIDSHYRTDPSSPRTLIGHSDGAFFTLHAFLKYSFIEDNPFQYFIALSGDYTKNSRLPFQEEIRMFDRFTEDAEVQAALYIAVGGNEESRFRSSNQAMAAVLSSRNYPGFRFTSLEYSEMGHSSIVYPGILSGLIWVFDAE